MKPPPLSELLVKHALAEVGVEEHPRGSNRGPRVDDYQRATWLEQKDWGAWCAAFVCFCMREAMREGESLGATYTLHRPQTAGAYDFQNWSLRQDDSTQTKINPDNDIKRGDIVIFTFSHIGIAASGVNEGGHFDTIEGNTNDDGSREGYAVCHKTGSHGRRPSQIRCRIRLTV